MNVVPHSQKHTIHSTPVHCRGYGWVEEKPLASASLSIGCPPTSLMCPIIDVGKRLAPVLPYATGETTGKESIPPR